jgi:membrane protease YdiL (CAAX protease family)
MQEPFEPDDLPPDAPDNDADDENDSEEEPVVAYRGATSDPTFGYLIAIALSFGLTALLPGGADLRYTLSWGAMALFGVLAWLLGNSERIGQEKPENLAWGITFGLIVGAPLFAFGGSTLATAVKLLFGMMSQGTLLAYLVFVMPLAETVFFRGVLQQQRAWWVVGALSSVWSAFLFFPLLDLGKYPFVAVVIGTAVVMMNMMYAYVRQRNGLAAAWLCQIVLNLVLVFLPSL